MMRPSSSMRVVAGLGGVMQERDPEQALPPGRAERLPFRVGQQRLHHHPRMDADRPRRGRPGPAGSHSARRTSRRHPRSAASRRFARRRHKRVEQRHDGAHASWFGRIGRDCQKFRRQLVLAKTLMTMTGIGLDTKEVFSGDGLRGRLQQRAKPMSAPCTLPPRSWSQNASIWQLITSLVASAAAKALSGTAKLEAEGKRAWRRS